MKKLALIGLVFMTTPVMAKEYEVSYKFCDVNAKYSISSPLLTTHCEVKKQLDEKDVKEAIQDITSSISFILTENEKKLQQEEFERNRFHFPAIGVYTSMFGWRENPLKPGESEFHTGVDIAGHGQIKSVLPGTVTFIWDNPTDGIGIEIDHGVVNGNRLKTIYFHLANYKVSVGQELSKGEEIGLQGTTGRSTGVHLHFEVIENDKIVDPKPYLDNAIAY